MYTFKKKLIWGAVAGASVILASCGSDSSSSSSGLSVKDLEYTGLESAASIDMDNYLEIATAAHGVTLGLLTEDYIGSYSSPFAVAVSGTVSGKQVSEIYDAIQKDLFERMKEQSGSKNGVGDMPASVLSTRSETHQYDYVYSVEGECGGSVEYSVDSEGIYENSEDYDADPVIDTYSETEGEDIKTSYNNYCVYMDDDVTEVIVNGSGTYRYDYFYSHDDTADTYHRENDNEGESSVSVLIDDNTFTIASTYKYEANEDSEYDADTSSYLYDADSFVREEKRNYAVSSPYGNGYYAYTESCSVDEADLSHFSCEEAELLEMHGITYKIDGSAHNEGDVSLDVYLGSYGYVTVVDGSSFPVLCDGAVGIESGQLLINGGDITIDYSGCSSATVTYDGNAETIDQ